MCFRIRNCRLGCNLGPGSSVLEMLCSESHHDVNCMWCSSGCLLLVYFQTHSSGDIEGGWIQPDFVCRVPGDRAMKLRAVSLFVDVTSLLRRLASGWWSHMFFVPFSLLVLSHPPAGDDGRDGWREGACDPASDPARVPSSAAHWMKV